MKAKIGAIFLVSVMAFAAIGAAYAHWEETLTITGEMTTDDIDPRFYCADTNDPDEPGSYDPTDCGDWVEGIWEGSRRAKNVGWMECDESADKKSIIIEIGDAYPCYYSHAYWCVENYGSCPVLIHAIKLTELSINPTPDVPEGNVELPVDVELELGHTYYVDFIEKEGGTWKVKVVADDAANAHKYDFSLMPTGDWGIDIQLDPQDWESGDGRIDPNSGEVYTDELKQDLCIHFENGCRQSYKYDFEIGMTFYNWPEYTTAN